MTSTVDVRCKKSPHHSKCMCYIADRPACSLQICQRPLAAMSSKNSQPCLQSSLLLISCGLTLYSIADCPTVTASHRGPVVPGLNASERSGRCSGEGRSILRANNVSTLKSYTASLPSAEPICMRQKSGKPLIGMRMCASNKLSLQTLWLGSASNVAGEC
jgi:hypothetical protein